MSPQRSRTRWSLAALVGALALMLLPATTAAAQQEPGTADYSGAASGELVSAELLSAGEGLGDAFPDLPLPIPTPDDFTALDVVVGDSETAVDGAGQLSFDEETNLGAYGHGSQVDAGIAGQSLPELVLPATDTAPPDDGQPETQELIGSQIPDNPLLDASVLRARGFATDASDDTCPEFTDGTATVSEGRSEVAGLELFPNALGEGSQVIGVGSQDAVSFVDSSVVLDDSLVDEDDDRIAGVRSTAEVQLADVQLFGQVTIEVLGNPRLTVTDTGDERTVEYTAPVIRVTGPDGEVLGEFDAADQGTETINVGTADAFALQIRAATPQDVQQDGSTVTISEVLHLSLLGVGDAEVLNLGVGPLQAAANAPSGGIDCTGDDGDGDNQVEVVKDGEDNIGPDAETFTSTITVENNTDDEGGPEECTLTDVQVVDEISGPDGTMIESTSPSGAQIEGEGSGSVTVTFTDGPDIEPGGSDTYEIVVEVPDDADGEVYSDQATVTSNCLLDPDGDPTGDNLVQEVEEQDSFDGPAVGAGQVGDVGDELDPDVDVSDDQMPRTGGGALAVLGLGGLLGAAALTRRS